MITKLCINSSSSKHQILSLSLKKAMQKELSIISKTFKVETCEGDDPKSFSQLSTWELLNLKVSTILDIPDRLQKEYGISSKFLQDSFGNIAFKQLEKTPSKRSLKSINRYNIWYLPLSIIRGQRLLVGLNI